MYIYAVVGAENKIVEYFETLSRPAGEEEPNYVLVDAIDETWIQRKRWNPETQEFEDVLPTEANTRNSLEFTHIDSDNTKHWLDDFVNDLAEDIDGKANTLHTHTIANINDLQSSMDAKQATITGGATTIVSSNLTANRALISNGSGKVAVSAVTSTELGYLDGVTSAIQTQLNGKSDTSHTHNPFDVGSVIIRYNSTSPASIYGGTWLRIEGRMLYGCASSGTVGLTGTHTTGTGSSSLPYVNVAIWRRTA